MIILPAIDLYGGRVVRLRKGVFKEMTEYGGDPAEIARGFADAGCRYLHVVDLEGAEAGAPMRLHELERLSGLGMEIEYGGGLRRREAIRAALDAGARRAMIGSVLFKGEDAAEEIFAEFENAAMPSIDVRDGRVVISGWSERTDASPASCLKRLASVGFRRFLVTSAERDGMLAGPDMELYEALLSVADEGVELIAAGGITTVSDVTRLESAGAFGAVVGKALYEGGFNLREAIAVFGGE
ncbi:MAG: 1-(5-phosphoribosyl)-5-[(5-phosphoribosylamino)methylideneamino] imidazole-4-carboxamide isomerase [Synergistaceae bacterium]|jgi:phosphoribosylformimino-5-aminoimidazole carboxamide ribotide isomerase|nr:1-(5-phosphoribosyl)-5-[(5-phosphoribosylamino)methylideneamino] imidazole-4-carboxamide isomerase [Synergistaceae bacterium]